MKKKLLFLFITVLTLTLVTGCIPKKSRVKVKEKEPKPTVITETNLESFYKIAQYVFKEEKDSLKVEDLTEEDKASIARNISEHGFLDTTGTEMIKTFQKYFGKDQTVTFKDINCDMKHQSAEEQVLYIFDKEKDMYIYNEKHPGHGGSLSKEVSSEIEFNSMEIEKDTYRYYVKVLFYGPLKCVDIGPCQYGNAYKTYKDAKNNTNVLVNINEKYSVADPAGGPPSVDLDKVMNDYKDQLNEYEFDFVKEDNNYIFKEYKKKED